MTLKEIAQEAGVSISTVSRVINQTNTSAASKKVQDKIWNIVRKNGYVPNSAARDLRRTGKPKTQDADHSIACLFARSFDSINDPFFMSLTRSIEESAYNRNYNVKMLVTIPELKNPRILHNLADYHIEGIVILGRCNASLVKQIKSSVKHVINISLNASNVAMDQVICDGENIGFTAVEYLIKLGHKNIGYIGEVCNERRYNGYRRALETYHLPFCDNNVVDTTLSSEGGYNGAKQLVTKGSKITAVFCANDTTAIGAINAYREEGLKIPKDISVISVDNIETSKYISPALTTTNIPLNEMGHLGFCMLADRIEGGHKTPISIEVPFSIIPRESTSPPQTV